MTNPTPEKSPEQIAECVLADCRHTETSQSACGECIAAAIRRIKRDDLLAKAQRLLSVCVFSDRVDLEDYREIMEARALIAERRSYPGSYCTGLEELENALHREFARKALMGETP